MEQSKEEDTLPLYHKEEDSHVITIGKVTCMLIIIFSIVIVMYYSLFGSIFVLKDNQQI